jgi:hypothetical protein
MDLRRIAVGACLVLAGCGGEHALDPRLRAATLRFGPAVAPGDREWILAAVDTGGAPSLGWRARQAARRARKKVT